MNLKRFANLRVDAYDDPAFNTKVASVFPAFVQAARRYGRDELAGLPDRVFAVVIFDRAGGQYRKWPLTDPAHVWLAAHYWAEADGVVPDAIRKVAAHHILCASEMHGLGYELPHRSELERARAALSALPVTNVINLSVARTTTNELTRDDEPPFRSKLYKSASAEVFALPGQRRYPIHTPGLLKRAEAWFLQHERNIDPGQRFIMAGNMLKQAEVIGEQMDPGVVKYAECGVRDDTGVKIAARMRFRGRAGFPKHGEFTLKKLAHLAETGEAEPPRLMRALLEFDKLAGLTRFWGSRLSDPAETFAAGRPKQAGINDYLTEFGGEVFTHAKLAEICAEHEKGLRRVYGDQLFEKLSSPVTGAETFLGLPDVHQDRFVKLGNVARSALEAIKDGGKGVIAGLRGRSKEDLSRRVVGQHVTMDLTLPGEPITRRDIVEYVDASKALAAGREIGSAARKSAKPVLFGSAAGTAAAGTNRLLSKKDREARVS